MADPLGEENGGLMSMDIEIKSEPINEEDFTATPFEIMPNEQNDKDKTDNILVWNTSVVKQESEDASATEKYQAKSSGKQQVKQENVKLAIKKDQPKPSAYKEFMCFKCLKDFGSQELKAHMVQVHGHKFYSKAYNPKLRVPYRSGISIILYAFYNQGSLYKGASI